MDAVDDDGWSEWVRPLPGYLMQCCDCGLIHEMEAVVARPERPLKLGPSPFDIVEGDELVVMFRMRRYEHTPRKEER